LDNIVVYLPLLKASQKASSSNRSQASSTEEHSAGSLCCQQRVVRIRHGHDNTSSREKEDKTEA
jgi:hypothetical protein